MPCVRILIFLNSHYCAFSVLIEGFPFTRACTCLLYTSHKHKTNNKAEVSSMQMAVMKSIARGAEGRQAGRDVGPVSYTHLDVYKRQM